jgi:hypothetical protein
MKNFHYTSIMLLGMMLCGSTLIGQCDPDFDFGESLWGASPDASVGEQFDTAYVSIPYADIFHVLVPTDASAIDPAFALPLDSVVLVATTLIDTVSLEMFSLEDVGLSIICNNLGTSPNPCALIAGQQYCASIEGTPTGPGVYQLSLDVQAYVTVFGIAVAQPYEFSGYIMDIIGEGEPDGIEESFADQISWYPNPSDQSFQLNPMNVDATIAVRDISGRIILSTQSFAQNTTRIATQDWNTGIYFISWTSDFEQKTSKMVVRHD